MTLAEVAARSGYWSVRAMVKHLRRYEAAPNGADRWRFCRAFGMPIANTFTVPEWARKEMENHP